MKPFLLFMCPLFFLASCATLPIQDLPEDQGMARIRASHSSSDWTDVTRDVDEFKSRYPYSQFNAEATLLQADSYFQSKKYTEAIFAYEDFIKKTPYHEKVPFASFRIAKSYDLESPDVPDRDQTNTKKALEKYTAFLEQFPTDPLSEEVKINRHILLQRLLEHETFVADFYWRKDLYAGALSRYLSLVARDLPDEKSKALVKKRIAACYFALAKDLEKSLKPESPPLSKESVIYFKEETPASLRDKGRQWESTL